LLAKGKNSLDMSFPKRQKFIALYYTESKTKIHFPKFFPSLLGCRMISPTTPAVRIDMRVLFSPVSHSIQSPSQYCSSPMESRREFAVGSLAQVFVLR
jgi:hypothetical protein